MRSWVGQQGSGRVQKPAGGSGDLAWLKVFLRGQEQGSWRERKAGKGARKQGRRKEAFTKESC